MTDPEKSGDVATLRHVNLLAATLDYEAPPWREGELPPLAHWLLFPPLTPQSQLGQDGHPARVSADLPRRMWAGSRLRFLAPIPLGVDLVRETTIVSVADKVGRSGRMQFVTLRHRVVAGARECLIEEQDIVYREAPTGPAGGKASAAGPASPVELPPIRRQVRTDPVQLFRYSALTFNGHRIHYDRPYATDVEGYPGLVVHGPFIATLLMDHFLRHSGYGPVSEFSWRAINPIFDIAPFTLALASDAHGGELGAYDHKGTLSMQARINGL